METDPLNNNQRKDGGRDDDDDEFIMEQLLPDIYRFRERYYSDFNVANLYLVQGTNLDLILDKGLALWDFPPLFETQGAH
jgi:hypothetical protein